MVPTFDGAGGWIGLIVIVTEVLPGASWNASGDAISWAWGGDSLVAALNPGLLPLANGSVTVADVGSPVWPAAGAR